MQLSPITEEERKKIQDTPIGDYGDIIPVSRVKVDDPNLSFDKLDVLGEHQISPEKDEVEGGEDEISFGEEN